MRKTSIHFLILAALSAIVFHEVFRMQFWKDDFALLYNLQINEPFYYPYHQLVMLYRPLYVLFGIEPAGYYAAGFAVFMMSAYAFYAYITTVSKNSWYAFIGSLVYVTSPTGADTIFMTMLYAAGYLVVLLLTLILLTLHKFHTTHKTRWFILSLLASVLAYECISYRSVYFLGLIVLYECVIFYAEIVKQKKAFVIRLLTYSIIWFFFAFLRPYYLLPDHLKHPNPQSLSVLFSDIVDYQLIVNPVLTASNVLAAGTPFIFYGHFDMQPLIVKVIVAVALFGFLSYTIYSLWCSDKKWAGLLAFSTISILVTTLTFYPFSAREISVVTFRYMVGTLPLYALAVVCVYVYIQKCSRYGRIGALIFLFTVVAVNTYSTMYFIRDFNTRAPYTRDIARKFKEYLPVLPEDAYVYVKLTDDAAINYRFIDTYRVGHYPPKAYSAVLYGLAMDDVNEFIQDDYKTLQSIAMEQPEKIDRIYAFQYDETGLHDITYQTRTNLRQEIDAGAVPSRRYHII